MSPLGAYVTIAQLTAVASLNCLTHWGKKCFFFSTSFLPNPAQCYLAPSRALGSCFAVSVLSALTFNVLFSFLQIDHYLKT